MYDIVRTPTPLRAQRRSPDRPALGWRTELDRLTAALAAGGALTSLLEALRQRERQLEALTLEVDQARAHAGAWTCRSTSSCRKYGGV